MPLTIDGKPFRTSSHSLSWRATRPGANSLTKIASSTPTGTAIAAAIAHVKNRNVGEGPLWGALLGVVGVMAQDCDDVAIQK